MYYWKILVDHIGHSEKSFVGNMRNDIPTLSSAPKTHPNTLNENIASTILRIRQYKYSTTISWINT